MDKGPVKFAPSILAADFARLGEQVVEALRPVTRLPLEVHRMITNRAAIDEAVPVAVLSAALYQRFSSRGESDYQDKLLSAMRFQFGGHLEKSEK